MIILRSWLNEEQQFLYTFTNNLRHLHLQFKNKLPSEKISRSERLYMKLFSVFFHCARKRTLLLRCKKLDFV